MVASALLNSEPENVVMWDAVYNNPADEGASRTVRELENYMVAWVSSVNTSTEREDEGGK